LANSSTEGIISSYAVNTHSGFQKTK